MQTTAEQRTREPRRPGIRRLPTTGALRLAGIGSILAALFACATPTAEQPPPDILLVVVDALRADHLGAYGYELPTSPFLDRMAREGALFEVAYSQASQTFNATASLLTSRVFPLRYSVTDASEINDLPAASRDRVHGLLERNVLLPELLLEAGYATAGFFDNPHHHQKSGFWQGFEHAEYLSPGRGAYAVAPRVYDAFFSWLDQRAGGPAIANEPGTSGRSGTSGESGTEPAGDDRPYFAYLHFMDVHSPYRPPRYLIDQFVKTPGRNLYKNGVPDEVPTPDDIQHMTELYDGSIRFLDDVLADLWSELERRQPDRRRILVVTSDHGDEFFEHGRFGHGKSLEPELLKVPLILHAPQQIEAGRRIARPARLLDIAPTLLDLIDRPAPREFEGHTLLPSVRAAGSPDPDSEEPFESIAWVGAWMSITTERWHFVRNTREGVQLLYDLVDDPAGSEDLSVAYPDVVQALSARVDQEQSRKRQTRQLEAKLKTSEQQGLEVDPAIVEQLEALGYLN